MNFDPWRLNAVANVAHSLPGSLQCHIFTAMSAQIKSNTTTTTLPPTIMKTANNFSESSNHMSDEQKTMAFHEHLGQCFSKQQCLILEEKSRSQNKSSLWHEQRKGRITGSQVHRVTQRVDEVMKRKILAKECQSRVIRKGFFFY